MIVDFEGDKSSWCDLRSCCYVRGYSGGGYDCLGVDIS